VSIRDVDIAAFEQAVRDAVHQVEEEPHRAAEVLTNLFNELSASELPIDEVARRTRRIVESMPARPEVQQAAARAASGAVPAVRTAVVGVLPPELQRAAYADVAEDVGPAVLEDEEVPAQKSETEMEVLPLLVSETGAWRTVFLLGDRQDADPNTHFLASRGYKAIRVATVDQFDTLVTESCCGMVMHTSWWQLFPDGQVAAEFVRRQLRTSNVLFYRLDSAGFDGAGLLAATRDEFDVSTQARVQIGAGNALTDFDVAQLDKVALLLEAADLASVSIEGITDSQRRLLAASAALFESEERANPGVGAGPVRLVVSPIVIGQSTARVVKVRVEGRRLTLVVKLDARERLQAELERARRVMPVDHAVHMKLYSLGGEAVLIQQLAANLDQPLEGAPSLKERLAMRSSWERGRRDSYPEPVLQDLDLGLSRLIQNIQDVNDVHATDDGVHCWTGVEPVEFLTALGAQWRIESDVGDFDPSEPLPWVSAKVAEHEGRCLVHGDLHAGNVLLMDDRTPRLIDFASAGAGHPCFDLVRVSSALAYSFIRPLSPEPVLRDFFRQVHLDGASAEDLWAGFPELRFESGARVAAKTLSLSREAAFKLLAKHEGGEEDYLAMVYLIGVQSLTMDEFQGAVVRAALGAIYPRVRELAGLAPAEPG